MRLARLIGLLGGVLAAGPLAPSQIVKTLRNVPPGGSLHRQLLANRRPAAAKTSQRGLLAYPNDAVFSQFVDGASWKSTITMTNLDSRQIHFTILFYADDGGELRVPVVGLGLTSGVEMTLNAFGSGTIETEGTGADLRQGWAYVLRDNLADLISGVCVFRARTPGLPDLEAAVPLESELNNRFVLVFDNAAGYVTGFAIANSWNASVTVQAEIRDEAGNVLSVETISLAPFQHVAFALPDRWPNTHGIRGSIEFTAPSAAPPSALGLRFNPTNAFTSVHVLTNVNWVVK